MITNENIQVISHEFTEHLSCGHYICDLVSQISRHSRLCWDIWLHVKLEHIYRHLMAGIKSYVISLELVTSLLITPTLSSIGVCRRPFMPTDSFYCAGRVRGCQQSPDCAGRLRIAQTPWVWYSIDTEWQWQRHNITRSDFELRYHTAGLKEIKTCNNWR